MSKNGSKKEMILTLYQKKYPNFIEDIVGLSVEGIKVEVDRGTKKIDLYGINRQKRLETFIENQTRPSDRKDHLLNKVAPIIQSISEGILIWTAPKFKQEHIDEVKKIIQQNPQKYINFYAVEIHPRVIEYIHELNNMYELEVWDNLGIINNVDEKFTIRESYIQMPKTHIGKAMLIEPVYDFEREDDVKDYMIKQFRHCIPYFLNFHSEKKHSEYDRILSVGAGLSNITYHCSAFDTRHRAFIEIGFSANKKNWYSHFRNNSSYLRREVHTDIQFDDKYRKIGVYFNSSRNDIPEVVDQLVDVFQRFILFFSQFTYGNRRIENLP